MKVLKFGAVWCPGCLVMKPRWAEIEKELSWLETEYFDYDESPQEVKKYSIDERLPSFIFLDKTGQEILRLQGEISKDELLKTIEENKNK